MRYCGLWGSCHRRCLAVSPGTVECRAERPQSGQTQPRGQNANPLTHFRFVISTGWRSAGIVFPEAGGEFILKLDMKRGSSVVVLALFSILELLGAPSAHAGLFSITNRNYGTAPASAQPSIDAIFNALENSVNANLPNADASTYLRGIADSSVISADGVGVDYATRFSLLDIGFSAGVGASLSGGGSLTGLLNGSTSTSTISGFAGQYSVMIGIQTPSWLNLGPIDSKRLRLFFNFDSSNFSRTGSTVQFSSFGLNAQYNLVGPESVGLGSLLWNGLDFTTGFRASSMNLQIIKSINDTSSGTVNASGNPTVTANFNGTADVGADVHTYDIPLEISTSARTFYIFTPYVGLGADLAFGSANGIANLSGPITVTDSSGSLGTISGLGTLNLGQNGGPSLADLRYFAGVEAQFLVVAAFVQYNQSMTDNTSGLSLGLRAYW